MGKQTLLLMGVPEDQLQEPSEDIERARISDFIELENQYNWMIQLDDKIVGAVWVDLEDTDHLKAPGIHIMIGDKAARGRGVGRSSIKAVIDFLYEERDQDKIYSRHLTNNEAISNLLSELGFEPVGNEYSDSDGLEWQNVILSMRK